MSTLFADVFGDSHRAFRDQARRFVEAEITPNATAWEEAEEFPKALFPKAGAAGLLGPTFPDHLGGGGGDLLHGVVLSEEMIRGGSAGVAAGLGSLAIALPPIVALGTPDQQARWIPDVLAGDKVAALAITEPGTGSDVAGVATRAVREGDDWVITGAKTFITSGVKADRLTVLARTGDDPHGGLTFFVVERGMPGFEVSRALKKTGWRASDTAELHFDSVRVPDANRLGPPGSGFLALMTNFESERLLLAVQGHALAEVALDEAVRYAKERAAFGRPIGKFQVIRHKLAEMATKVNAAKALNYRVAGAMVRGDKVPAEVAMAKNFAGEVARDVTWEAVQIFGGMGFMRETLVGRLARDARLIPIGGGTHEIMNEVIARFSGW